MRWFGATSPSVLAAALGPFASHVAFAANPACPSVAVQAGDSVLARWPQLPARIREAFGGRDDIDACARIELTKGNGSTLGVTVVLPDGRSAWRSTTDEDVLPTLEGLLLLPHVDVGTSAAAAMPGSSVAPSAAVATAQSPFPMGVGVDAPQARRDEGSIDLRVPTSPPNRLRIELSIVTDARVGDGQTAVGIGAVSLVEVRGWLVGFGGRVDRYQQLAGGPTSGALELAALCGRRYRLQNLAVDLSAGPALALRGTENVTTVTPMGTATSQSNERLVPRGLLGARLNFSARSAMRTFVGLEGEFGPAGVSREHPSNAPDLPGLPVWAVGLALGATVGTQ